ncbi:MAG: efflux RND transporter periplasmic adaptor subunit [Chitinophagaceae bacterium]|nr:efflux RND transporter periplasmic adaptor subunit [Chitinophagaceae bacterium]
MKILRLLIYLSFIFFWSSCNSGSEATDSEENLSNTVSAQDTLVTNVQTAFARAAPFQYLIQSNGKIHSLHEQLIVAETGGVLMLCRAQTGARFAGGETIAQFETIPLKQKLEKAELARFNGQKEYESQLLGYENLLKDRSKAQADTIRQKLRISTGLSGAEQDIKQAEYELSKAVIEAPFGGVLADVKVQPGQYVKPGDEMFRIYDPTHLLLEVKILESDIGLVKKGMSAEVSPVSNPEKRYNATVYEINPYVDENGLVLVKLKVVSPDISRQELSLFPGMNCTATIIVPFSKTLVVPKEAVVMRSNKAVVFTFENGKAKWNYVETGRDNGKEVEIKEGLQAGQKVITTNNLQLAHDAPVKEAPTASSNAREGK